jgi:hypothetical protein
MLKLLLEAVFGRRMVKALQTLVAGIALAVMVLVPGAAATIFHTAIHEEQERITPFVEHTVDHLSRNLNHKDLLQSPHATWQHPNH